MKHGKIVQSALHSTFKHHVIRRPRELRLVDCMWGVWVCVCVWGGQSPHGKSAMLLVVFLVLHRISSKLDFPPYVFVFSRNLPSLLSSSECMMLWFLRLQRWLLEVGPRVGHKPPSSPHLNPLAGPRVPAKHIGEGAMNYLIFKNGINSLERYCAMQTTVWACAFALRSWIPNNPFRLFPWHWHHPRQQNYLVHWAVLALLSWLAITKRAQLQRCTLLARMPTIGRGCCQEDP